MMRKMDKDGLLLCDLQGSAFELSVELTSTSSEIFMRRFMNSKVAKMIDNESVLQMNLQSKDIIKRVEEEYKESKYGSVKYTKNEMYWIGYLYRYFSYTYELSSTQVYKIVKPKELRGLFLPYHTLGVHKYDDLKISYPLKGVSDMDKDKCKKLEDMLKEGLK